MFEAELWPRKRPPVRTQIVRPAEQSPLFRAPSHTELQVSLTAPRESSGFVKGVPEKVVFKPFPIPANPKPVIQGGHKTPDPEVTVPPVEAPSMPSEPPAESNPEALMERPQENTSPVEEEASETPPAESGEEEVVSSEEPSTDVLEAEATAQTQISPDKVEAAGARHIFDEALLEELRQEAFEAGRQAGFATGLAQGMQQGQQAAEAGLPLLLEQTREEGRQEAKAMLTESLREEFEAPARAAVARLNQLADDLASRARDTASFHDPLKRLAMHLAEQLVRGELTLSSAAISRLIDRALLELGQETRSPVSVYLNPQDLQQIRSGTLTPPEALELRVDETLTPGSLRVSMNGAVIEDLIETRHKALWRALVQDEQAVPPASFLRSMDLVKDAMDDIVDEVIDAD